MSTLKFSDGADEFRIEIGGRFAGACVQEVEQRWLQAQSEASPRKITIDISRVSAWEYAGERLLRSMHQHGTAIAAATPRSLVFLSQITNLPRRGPAPALVRESARPAAAQEYPAFLLAKAASGDR